MDDLRILVRRPGEPTPPGCVRWEDLPDQSVESLSEAFDDMPEGSQLAGNVLKNVLDGRGVADIELDHELFAGSHRAADLGFLVGLRQFLRYHLSLRLAVWSRHLAEGNAIRSHRPEEKARPGFLGIIPGQRLE